MTWINTDDCHPQANDTVIITDGINLSLAYVDKFHKWHLYPCPEMDISVDYWHPIKKLAKSREKTDKIKTNKKRCIIPKKQI